MWYVVVAVAVVFLVGGFALYKHRQQIKAEAQRDAQAIKDYAVRQERKVTDEGKQLYQGFKSKLP